MKWSSPVGLLCIGLLATGCTGGGSSGGGGSFSSISPDGTLSNGGIAATFSGVCSDRVDLFNDLLILTNQARGAAGLNPVQFAFYHAGQFVRRHASFLGHGAAVVGIK